MTLRDFTRLSNQGKTEVVELRGIELNEKVVPGFKVKVYQVDSFFVEVYHTVVDGLISRFRACSSKEAVYN